MTFSYTAKLPDWRTIHGSLEAASEQVILQILHDKELVVLQVKQTQALEAGRGRVGLDDLAIFCRQLATLVDAGIPIVGSLEAVADQMENRTLRTVAVEMRNSVEGGVSLTAAIARQGRVFSGFFVSMIRAGEVSGHLSEVLEQLAVYLEKSASLQRKVRMACVYPAVVITMPAIVTGILVLTVIPAFKEIFSTLGAALPLPTQILMGFSDWARKNLIPGGIGLSFSIFLFRLALRNPKGRFLFDRFLLQLKIIGPIVRKVAIARFARTLATLIKSGIQILAALEIVSETAGNRVVAEAVLKVRNSIREGENIAAPLAACKVFPPMVVRMIAVGEQTGRLDDMLTKVADFYEDQVDAAISGLTSAIEPVIIAVLGVVIGSIVFAIFLPLFKITQLVVH